eukprot:COSAG02_NODE_21285_length_794_cov_3.060470_1_plen_222_part_10
MGMQHMVLGWDPHVGRNGAFAPGASPRAREGVATVEFTDTSFDGGFSELGVFVYACFWVVKIDGTAADEPNARWNFTFTGTTIVNHKSFTMPFVGAYVNPPLADKQLHLDAHWADTTISNSATIGPSGGFDSSYLILQQGIGSSRFTRSRTMDNGRVGVTGTGGVFGSPPEPGGSMTPLFSFQDTAWIENKAGVGPAIYMHLGQVAIEVRHCVLRDNVAYKF